MHNTHRYQTNINQEVTRWDSMETTKGGIRDRDKTRTLQSIVYGVIPIRFQVKHHRDQIKEQSEVKLHMTKIAKFSKM